MRKILLLSLLLLMLSCSGGVEQKRAIHVHVSSGIDSAIVVFESEDSVKVINYKQKKDSVKTRSKSQKRKKKEIKPKKKDPVPSFGVPRI